MVWKSVLGSEWAAWTEARPSQGANEGAKVAGKKRHEGGAILEEKGRCRALRNHFGQEAPIFIAVYDNRVEITSPGGLPRGQTAERAVTGFSKIRNEALAKALNYMHLMEEWGSGLKRVNDVLGDYGLRPVAVEDAGFAVRMNVFRVGKSGVGEAVNEVVSEVVNGGDGMGETVTETVNAKKKDEKPGVETVNAGRAETVNEAVTQILSAIKRNPGIRKPGLLKIVKTSRATVVRALARLQALRKIEFRGAPKTGGYYCKE